MGVRFEWMQRLAMLTMVLGTAACATPYVDKNTGMWAFSQGKKGAVVVTANGTEFRDVDDVPKPVVYRDAEEAWRSPVGFILPKNGKFTQTSTPLTIASQGIVIVLRSSDTRVPSWGGEILLRVDIHAVGSGAARAGEHVAVIIDGEGDESAALVSTALSQLGSRDRITVIDVRGPRLVVPTMPATHRSLVLAATTQRLLQKVGVPRDISGALRMAGVAVGNTGARRVLLLSRDACKLVPCVGLPVPAVSSTSSVGQEVAKLEQAGVAVRSFDPLDPGSTAAVHAFVPPVGPIAFKNLAMTFDSSPAPARVLEASGGETLWMLDGGQVTFGDIRAGEARSEILRVTVPAWMAKTRFRLRVAATALDASSGLERTFPAHLDHVYDNDIERIAESRHGDVIAYASALATLHRLHAAFIGLSVEGPGGVRQIARMQAKSLALLAHDFPDRGFAEDAAIFEALLNASEAPN